MGARELKAIAIAFDYHPIFVWGVCVCVCVYHIISAHALFFVFVLIFSRHLSHLDLCIARSGVRAVLLCLMLCVVFVAARGGVIASSPFTIAAIASCVLLMRILFLYRRKTWMVLIFFFCILALWFWHATHASSLIR